MSLFHNILRRLGLTSDQPPSVSYGSAIVPESHMRTSKSETKVGSSGPRSASKDDIQPGSDLETGGFGPVLLPEVSDKPVRRKAAGMTIRIQLPADRAKPGTLELLSPDGDVLSGPWPAVGKADPALGADYGNPSCDRLKSFGDAPTGGYEVIALLPPAAEERGAMLVGPNGVIQLRPISGEAAEADRQGRTSLLIHGGRDHLASTDGSIRIPDEGMAELVSFIPARPGAMQPRIQVVIEDTPVHSAWAETAPRQGSKARQSWYSSTPYRSRTTYDSNTYVGYDYYGNDFSTYMMLNYYQQMYMWEALRTPPMCLAPTEVTPDVPVQGQADFRTEQDQAAAAALGQAGFVTMPDSPAAEAAASASPVDATPTSGAETRQPEADFREQPSTAYEAPSSYSPAGGAYDR